MAQLVTLGKMPAKMPKGFFKAVEFPTLAKLDTQTGDHRMLAASGAGARDLPLSIKYATQTSAMGGHDTAEVSGALFEVTIDPDNQNMSGRGFLLDDEHGRRHARLAKLGAMRGNSIDTVEVKARLVEDFETGEWWVEFTDFKIGATTGVSTPAFADARMEVVDEMSDDELVASLTVEESPMTPLVVQAPEEFWVTVSGELGFADELVASMSTTVPFEAFYTPEADRPTKIVVDADGRVYGHLALWGSCHDGYADKCMLVPRPTDGYASFNQAGPLTERGQVETGPIFALGGHRKAKSAPTIEQAYGGIENTWCDVRVTEGQFGPWVSGIIRPGVDSDLLYAVRASRISGHWVNGKLKAIVSVNVPGYEVPGSGDFNVDFSTGFAYATDDQGVTELVASFPGCVEPEPAEMQMTLTFSNNIDPVAVTTAIAGALQSNGNYFTINPQTGTGTTYTFTPSTTFPGITTLQSVDAEADAEEQAWHDAQLAALLEDDRDEDDV